MAVLGIGVDMESISRFKNAGDKLLKRLFTKGEIDFCFKLFIDAVYYVRLYF